MATACSKTGKRHKWEHVKDVTNKTVRAAARGAIVRLTLRGQYRCECGETRIGQPKGGL